MAGNKDHLPIFPWLACHLSCIQRSWPEYHLII